MEKKTNSMPSRTRVEKRGDECLTTWAILEEGISGRIPREAVTMKSTTGIDHN